MKKNPDFYYPDGNRRQWPSYNWIQKQKAKGLGTQEYLNLWAELGGKKFDYKSHTKHLSEMKKRYQPQSDVQEDDKP